MKITKAEPGGLEGKGLWRPGGAGHPPALRERGDEEVPRRRIRLDERREGGGRPWPAFTTGRSGGRCPTGIPESRPKKQFAAVFDINKCIACQTCTLACKTTWTSGKGQEYMLWNNVESKPYGFYPLAWDVKLLEQLGPQTWDGGALRGPDDLRGGARGRARPRLAARRDRLRPPQRRRGRLRRADRERAPSSQVPAHDAGSSTWRASATTAPTRPASRPARAARSTSAPRTASSWSTRAAAAATRSASRPAPTRRSSSTR